MGSIGLPEVIVILVVALIVLGPTRLPEAARQVGRAVSEFRRVSSGIQAEVRDAFADPLPMAPAPPPEPEPAATAPAPAAEAVPAPSPTPHPDPEQ